jgi:hypothetical protein
VIPHRLSLIVQPLLVAGTLLGLAVFGGGGWLLAVVTGFGAYFVTCMICHRELYACRPDRRHLTGFYLWMSLGGVLGGVFSAILAPQVFDAFYELPILMILGLTCRPGLAAALADRREVAAVSRVPVLLMTLVAVMALGLALLKMPDLLHRVAVMLPSASSRSASFPTPP